MAGVSRFVLAGLSAALPHVVARRHLVEANVVAATAGAGVAALGGATAIGLRALVRGRRHRLGADHGRRGARVGAGRGARRRASRPGCSGRTGATSPTAPLVAVARGLADGARATARTPTVAASFLALAAHRLAFGVSTLLMLMLFRYTFTGSGVLRGGMAGRGGGRRAWPRPGSASPRC